MNDESNSKLAIAGYGSGSASTGEINDAIAGAWKEILKDNKTRKEAAEYLGVSAQDLPEKVPFEATSHQASLTEAEVAILVFAGGLAGDVAYDFAKEAVKETAKFGFRLLWDNLVKERADATLPTGGIGEESKIPDDIQ